MLPYKRPAPPRWGDHLSDADAHTVRPTASSLASAAPSSRHVFAAAGAGAAQPEELRSYAGRAREEAEGAAASEVDRQIERAWYDDAEGGGHGDAFDPFSGDDASFAKREVEVQKRFTRRDGTLMTLAQSKRVNQVNADRNAWEENRLVTSGVARLREVDLVRLSTCLLSCSLLSTDQDDNCEQDHGHEEETRITLLVHDSRPPFLEGRAVATKQSDTVLPVKDVTSDLAVVARKGSALVREYRRKRDENKSRERFWELGGTHMGNLLGLQQQPGAEGGALAPQDGAEGEDVEFREGGQFAKHMSGKSAAVSEFARNRTIAEQRAFLPVSAVREDLMHIIRENNVVVVVGETGSGKTTQMTQFMVEDGYGKYGIVGCTQPRRVAVRRLSCSLVFGCGCIVKLHLPYVPCTPQPHLPIVPPTYAGHVGGEACRR